MANPVDNMWEQSITPDPFLGSDSFIFNDPNQQTPPDRTSESNLTSYPEFVAIGDASHASVGGSSDSNAVPWSDPLLGSGDLIIIEGDYNCFEAKQAKRAKKGTEDEGETSGGLPTGWTIISKTRANGATAGTVDKYYIEPATGRKFRSKIEVKRYLKTGYKKKLNSNANTMTSKKTGEKKKKNKKEATLSFDFKNQPEEVTWSHMDVDQGLWKPSIGGEQVPETIAQEWVTAFERTCQME